VRLPASPRLRLPLKRCRCMDDACRYSGAYRPPGDAVGSRAEGFSVRSSGNTRAGAGCSTSATTRLAMNRAVRTGVPARVTSTTSTTPRPMLTSTRRPALLAVIS
jgi:hypothetical protein